MNRGQIKTQLKSLIRRNFSDIDTILEQCIDMAVELMGRNISAIYDEEEWFHTITNADHTNKINNWQLPSSFKKLLWVTLNDLSPDDDVHYPLNIISPYDQYELFTGAGRSSFDYGVDTARIRDGISSGARIDFQMQPTCAWQLAGNLYVYPFPSSNEENWTIQAGLQVLPAALTADGESNTISINYPQALIFLAGTLFWGLHLNDPFRFQTWLQLTTTALTGVAKEQELSKLSNINLTIKTN